MRCCLETFTHLHPLLYVHNGCFDVLCLIVFVKKKKKTIFVILNGRCLSHYIKKRKTMNKYSAKLQRYFVLNHI